MTAKIGRYSSYAFFALALAFALVVFANALFGIFYDSDHFGDTLFLLGAAWRVHEGLTPVIDFGHFYGGVMAEGLALTMRIVGHGTDAFDVFTLLLLVISSSIGAILLYPRISIWGFAGLVLTLATLLLTRFPLEIAGAVTEVRSAHSFLYNRAAFAGVLLAGLFVALPHPRRRADIVLGLLAGAVAAIVCLIKPTFVILAPALLSAFSVQGRWGATLGAAVGIASALLVLDPGLLRLAGSFDYALAHVGESNGVAGLVRKSIQVPMAQPVAVIIGLWGLATLIGMGRMRDALALLVVAGAGIGMTATMGGNGSLGQLALPVAIMTSLAAAEIAREQGGPHSGRLRAMTTCLLLAFAVPHLLNLAAASAKGYLLRGERLIVDGPYAEYLSLPERRPADGPTQYEMLADGLAALDRLGDASAWGIVANKGITFEYALMARPVPGYPLWQRATAPEFDPGRPFVPSADIVMLAAADMSDDLGTLMRGRMGEDFVLCATSRHWEIHRRATFTEPACDLE